MFRIITTIKVYFRFKLSSEVEKRLYHINADLMQTQIFLSTNRYKTFPPFSYLTLCSSSELNRHMMSEKPILIFNKILLSFIFSAPRYTPKTSKMVTLHSSYASKISVQKRFSRDTVSNEMLSPSFFKYYWKSETSFLPWIINPSTCGEDPIRS